MKQLIYFPNIYPPAGEASAVDAVEKSFAKVVANLRRWHRRSAQRRQLAVLSVRLLDDAGITEAQRLEEISKPFWRA